MRICFVTTFYPTRHPREGSGIDTRVSAQGMAQRGHDIHVICINQGGGRKDDMDGEVSVHFVPPRRVRIRGILRLLAKLPGLHRLADVRCAWGLVEASLGVWLEVIRLHRQQSFDLIQAVDTAGIAFFGLLWPGRSPPLVIRGHGFVDPQLPDMQWCGAHFQHWLERFCLQRVNHVITNSRYLSDTYRVRFGLPEERVGVLFTGFHLLPSPSANPDVRQGQGWGADDPIILFVGRIEYLKGCDLLFQAMQYARQQDPRLRLVLLGEVQPSFRTEYESFMQRNQDWAWHPGNVPLSDVSHIMYQASVVVLPSRRETFGRVLVEAQLHSLPVVGTKIGGIPEIITHGDTGLLVQAEDATGLAQAILRLVKDEACRQQMGEQAFANASRRFGFENVVRQQAALYASLIGHMSPPSKS
jgi:glycosyltransferase involved in cell wall biosynthesis